MRALLLAITGLICCTSASGAQESPFPYAERAFERAIDEGLGLLQVQVTILPSEEQAGLAMKSWTTEESIALIKTAVLDYLAGEDVEGKIEVGTPPDVGDEAFLLGGEMRDNSDLYRTSVLMIRDGRRVYMLVGASRETDPLPDLVTIFESIEGRTSSDPEELLPAEDDLPFSMTETDL